MTKTIHCFLPYGDSVSASATVKGLKQSPTVKHITFLVTEDAYDIPEGCDTLKIDSLKSTSTVRSIAEHADGDYLLLYTKENALEPGYFALERFMKIATDSNAGMLYSDSYTIAEGVKKNAPVIDCQLGSLRDDFDFGSVLVFKTSDFKKAASGMNKDYKAAGLYDMRLRISRIAKIVHINEYLYSDITLDNRKTGEKMFDYVDPRNRASQLEMEDACTEHLKAIGAYLKPEFDKIEFTAGDFKYEASVIIPVRNRARTIADAVKSALSQKTDFPYNVIVIDNHSTDGTTDILRELAAGEPRLVHIIPERDDLGIGGCWNLGVFQPECGRFAVQLDSDDVYSSENTLATVVKAFYEQNCAMVVGTYMLTDINLQMIPPGIIDHKEWTPENGRNNALRINGFGAPRAFYTPVLREITVPNTSYGEDYALGLAFSRHYQIGRIFDVLYYCRRWEDNSDAALDIVKMNGHNLYKDRIRTWEVEARQTLNKEKAE